MNNHPLIMGLVTAKLLAAIPRAIVSWGQANGVVTVQVRAYGGATVREATYALTDEEIDLVDIPDTLASWVVRKLARSLLQ